MTLCHSILAGIILCVPPANEGQCYIETSSLIGWAHMQSNPCSSRARSIPWLLMPWLLRKTSHQQPRYWLCEIHIGGLSVTWMLWNDMKCEGKFMFLQNNLHKSSLGSWNGTICLKFFLQLLVLTVVIPRSPNNYANPVYGFATICHQVRCLRWGHPSLFYTATSLLILYKMFCMRDISYRLIWMKFINMLS